MGSCISNVNLKDAHASHVQPVTSFHMGNSDQCSIAAGTTQDCSHTVDVSSQCPDVVQSAAPGARCVGKRHLKWKDLLKDSGSCIAIQSILHHATPVGPKRSVLIRAASYPSATRFVATASTNEVGPQMNINGRCSGDHATSRRRPISTRR